tara:strand:- start:47229 stop:50096 length:2868 start_codon:yes stop_codon:yes gene_type:complete
MKFLLSTILLGVFTLLSLVSRGQCPVADPSSSNACLFSPGSANLTASGSTGYYHWYFDSMGDSVLSTGANYSTPYIVADQTFYVAATDTNTGLTFDGTDDIVALNKSYNAVGAIQFLTVEAWVNTSYSGGGNFDNWSIVDFDRSEYYNLFITGNTGVVGFSTYSSTGGIDDFYSVIAVNDGNWHHIAAVYDGIDKVIYIDGFEVSRKTNPHGGDLLGSGNTRFGFLGDGSEANTFNGGRNNNYYSGSIDELRIWDDVRTPAEIMNFRDTCLNGSEANLDAYYNFDEHSGTSLSDLTGNGGDGTLFNMDPINSWIEGATIKCDCESNLIPVDVVIQSNLKDTLLTCSAPSITLDAGSLATNYSWSTGETTQTIDVNQGGFYEVTTTGGSCNGSARIVVDGFTHAENALLFDGANDYAAVEDMFYEGNNYTELTVEGWIKTTNSGDQVIASFDRNEYWRVEVNGSGAGAGQIGFDVLTSSGQVDFGGSTRIDDGQWHHIACVYDNGQMTIYIDGIDDGTTTGGSQFGTGTRRYGYVGVGSESSTWNGNKGPTSYFDGEIDELKIWERALSQTEIRTNMAKHISGSSTGLQVYYKFDDISTDTIYDHNTSVVNNAIMFNFGVGAELISAAPIGDESVYLYTGSWAGQTPFINSCDGETFTLSNMSGTPDAVHLYYVNSLPNDFSGLSGSGTYDRYFGVHKINDPAATYTATYNYTGNPYIDVTNEATVEMFRRADNATFPWINTFGNLDTGLNTIEATGQNTEFILDYDFSVLPVELITFQGSYSRELNKSILNWKTASEKDCDYFVVEHGTDGFIFDDIDTVQGQGTISTESNYKLHHLNPSPGINYYKLVQYDFDGSFDELGIISVYKVSEENIKVYPNPVSSDATLTLNVSADQHENVDFSIYSLDGKIVRSESVNVKKGSNTIQLSLKNNLSPGVYNVLISGQSISSKVKLVVY